MYDNDGNVLKADQSETLKRWNSDASNSVANNNNAFNLNNPDLLSLYAYGRRYGIDPELAQANGTFYIDNANGVVRFSSDLNGRIVTLKYISDGLGSDEDMVVHKFAVDAIYKYILHAVLSTRANTQEYLVARYKRELSAARRNAKIRLSQLKSELIVQVMRNQSKWIKH
jgi:hypothetical protein